VSFSIGFKRAISWGERARVAKIISSPFNITLYRQDELWDSDVNLGDGILSLWSGTCCISYQKGMVYDKTLEELTREEFEVEVITQLKSCPHFMGSLDGEFSYDRFEVWYDWKFGSLGVSNTEPKFVDSYNTQAHQLKKSSTGRSNIFITGAHMRTSMDLWSMEAAAESGLNCAVEISGGGVRYELKKPKIFLLLKSVSSHPYLWFYLTLTLAITLSLVPLS
jgi:hypothetical protein